MLSLYFFAVLAALGGLAQDLQGFRQARTESERFAILCRAEVKGLSGTLDIILQVSRGLEFNMWQSCIPLAVYDVELSLGSVGSEACAVVVPKEEPLLVAFVGPWSV